MRPRRRGGGAVAAAARVRPRTTVGADPDGSAPTVVPSAQLIVRCALVTTHVVYSAPFCVPV
ncbi:hypothetical protein GCM10010249_24070 [Streptomyces roseolilacinus]|uniref:Uncharacterized protein n=1 Tax=Streptomyces roseolilacinus TaxID=66904 RepID=A0A918EJF5_9ACTN|nr:hypothetical protein GCM10010249_24070 [Streptomyces roseolilacinus]